MGFQNLFKKIGKNLLVATIGAIIGVVISIFYVFKIWIPSTSGSIGLGIIAILPVMIILFSITGLIVGGIIGILFYHLLRKLRKN